MIGDGFLFAFLAWVAAHVEATGIPEEVYLPERMAVLHLPGEGTMARLVWTGDGPRLAAVWLSARNVPAPTDV